VAQAGGFFNWSIDPTLDMQDKTTFQSNGWKEFESTLNGFTGSAEAYWGDEQFFEALGSEVIVVLHVNESTGIRYEGYAIISADGIKLAVDELIQETVEFQGDGSFHYRE